MTKQKPVDQETRSQIQDFLVRAAHLIDDDRLEEWPGLFSADALYEITTRENLELNRPIGIIRCEGQGMLKDRVVAMRTANIFEAHTYCHLIGQPEITAQGGRRYAARSNFLVHRTMYTGATELFALGKYVDLISLEGAEPVFLQRQVVLDPRSLDTLLVIPL